MNFEEELARVILSGIVGGIVVGVIVTLLVVEFVL